MLVRTRPSDRQQVIVTTSQAAEIEADWEEHHRRAQRLQQLDPAELEAERLAMRQQLSSEPQVADIVWSLLRKRRHQHAVEQAWPLYRNDVLAMAERHLLEERHMVALAYLLDVCALDAWLEEHLELQQDLSESRLRERFAPGVLSMLDEAIEGAGKSLKDIEPLLRSRRVKLSMLARWQVTPSALATSLVEALSSLADA